MVALAGLASLSRRSLKDDLDLLKVRLEAVLPGLDVLKLTAAATPTGLSSVRALRSTHASAEPSTAAAARPLRIAASSVPLRPSGHIRSQLTSRGAEANYTNPRCARDATNARRPLQRS